MLSQDFKKQVAGYGLINVSLPRLPAVVTSLLLLSQPVATLALGGLLLAEAPSPIQFGGVALILGGVVIAVARRSRGAGISSGVAEPA